MARQILPIAGQIIGGMVGGPVGAAIGGAIGSAVGSYVDPIRHQGPKLGEARAQTAQEGVYRPLVFGTGAVAGNVIHRSPRKVVRHRESVGKGGRDTVDSDRGYRTFAIRIAEAHNPDGYQLLRIWENETLVYDVRPESEIPVESAEYAEKFRFYKGTHDQLPDPDLESYLGVGNVNSYRGSCYIVFGNFDLTDYGDMVPQYRFEVASEGELAVGRWSEEWSDFGVELIDGGRTAVTFENNSAKGDAELTSGKWYWEIYHKDVALAQSEYPNAGIDTPDGRVYLFQGSNLWTENRPSARAFGDIVMTYPDAEWTDPGSVWRFAYDADNGTFMAQHNNRGWVTLASDIAGLPARPYYRGNYGGQGTLNAAPQEFIYDPPDGYLPYVAASQGHGDSLTLSRIVGWCHRRVGIDESLYDVDELNDAVDGVVFADGYSARDAIITLLPIYNADASEHDRGNGYRVNYLKRGSPVVRTLTIDDLVDEPEETVREDPMERPRVLHMSFESPVTGYTAGKASIQRISPDVKLVNEVSTYVPVTFKDVDEAWQRADVQMRVAWTEVHGERTFSIADDQLDIVPSDVIGLSLRGQVQRLRVLKVEYAAGVMKMEAVADRQSNYTSHVTGIPLPAPEPPPPSLMGPAALAILDIPAISDQHDRLGYYVAVSGTTEAYAGAVIQHQQNGEWSDLISLSRNQRAIMGILEGVVPASSQHYTDTTNTVSVALHMDDELQSLSQPQWLNKGGAFALETASGWEIMQYRDVEQDSNGVWHLTYLARGRLNTDPDEHFPGARFVLLDGVHFIEADVGMIGEPLTLRAAAVGRSPETAAPETITYQGNSQREFPCAHLAAEIDSDGLSISCVPRDRFGTEQHPVRSINHEGLRWTATDGSETITADTDATSASLDASGLSLPITVTVAQLNRFTGSGPEISEQIE